MHNVFKKQHKCKTRNIFKKDNVGKDKGMSNTAVIIINM